MWYWSELCQSCLLKILCLRKIDVSQKSRDRVSIPQSRLLSHTEEFAVRTLIVNLCHVCGYYGVFHNKLICTCTTKYCKVSIVSQNVVSKKYCLRKVKYLPNHNVVTETSAAPGRCIHGLGKYRYGKCYFRFRTLFKWLFSTFLIFPRGSGAYFDGIFDQKFFRPKSAKIYGAKVGRSDPKVGGVIWVTNSLRLENHGKSSKLNRF